MRWFVDISMVGPSNEAPLRLCLEAPQWQPALQQARARLGEAATLSNMSVELLADGYRAIDPTTKRRYELRKAPADAPLTPEEASTDPRADGAANAPRDSRQPKPSRPPLQIPADRVPPPPARPKPTSHQSTAVAGPSTGQSSKEAVPASNIEFSSEALPEHRITTIRESDPTDDSPLTYREEVLVVAPGTTEDDAIAVVLARFDKLQKTLATAPAGKLIQLAVFDYPFNGEVQSPPLVALTWKDWRGLEPEVRFPARAGAERSPTEENVSRPVRSSSPAPSLVDLPPGSVGAPAVPRDLVAAAALEAPPARAPEPIVEPSPKPASSRPAPAAPATPRPPPTPGVPPRPETLRGDGGSTAKKLTQSERPAEVKPTAPRQSSTRPPAPSSPSGASGPVSIPAGKRLSGDDLIVVLFEALSDLHFLPSALEGAGFVLELALANLPSQVALVSFFDIDAREFVVVRQFGGRKSIVSTRFSERSPLAATAMRTKQCVLANASAIPSDDRWSKIGIAPTSLLVAPVELGGRYLGLLELANPLDGAEFRSGDAHALTYIGQQFAEFVADRGILLEPDAIIGNAKTS